MRRFAWILAGLLVAVITACSGSSEPMQVEFSHPMNPDAEALGASGEAVDEGIVCSEGSFERLRMENTDGEIVSESEGARGWEEAMGSGATITMILYEEFNCSDGSGSISFVVDNVVQPSTLDFEGANDVGTWEITGGTGSYGDLSGSGTLVANFGAGVAEYAGEVHNG